MENNEVIEPEVIETTKEKFEIPESFREKYTENPDLAIEQLYKAQHKIIQEKKAKKELPTSNWLDDEQFAKLYQEQKFFEENPDMLEHKDKIKEYTSKDLTHKQAMKLVIEENPDIINRQTIQKSNFTAWSPDIWKTSFTKEDLSNMNYPEYKKAMWLIESWKAVKV